MDEEIVTQLGLILTQLRYTRRALEDVERSTARYNSFAFASALQQGPRFGAPPLFADALKVYVVNIDDLAPGGGFGGFLEGLLGGIGRFFGGFFGGLIGGTIGGVALPVLLGQLWGIANTIERIITRLGIPVTPKAPAAAPAPATAAAAAATPKAEAPSEGLLGTLREIKEVANTFTALFQAASTGPEAAAKTSALPATETGQKWMAMMETTRGILQGISHVIDGLILLVPILLGTLAVLIARLDTIKLAVVELMQFALQNIFLLRGVILVTVFDTLSAAARLGATILGILATAVERILGAVFRIIEDVLNAALEAIRFIATGLQRTVDALLRWLLTTLFAVLTALADTLVFRVFVHIIQIIPAVLPPLYELKEGFSLDASSRKLLEDAAKLTIMPAPSGTTGAPSAAIPAFPNLAEALTPATDVAALQTVFADTSRDVTAQVKGIFGSAQGALANFGRALNTAAATGEAKFTARLNARLETVAERSTALAKALQPAEEAAAKGAPSGLEAIAQAYEGWLSGGGLKTLLGTITQHFRNTPTSGPAAQGTIPAAVVGASAADRPRATIDIQDVVIELAPPPEGAAVAPAGAAPPAAALTEIPPEVLLRSLQKLQHELQERGMTPDTGSLLTQFA